MNDAEFIKVYKEVMDMYKKIYRPRSPEYIYDRWWRLQAMISWTENQREFTDFQFELRRWFRLTNRIVRLRNLQERVMMHLEGEPIFNHKDTIFVRWSHISIYGREYIWRVPGNWLYPALLADNCHYIIEYHDKDTV